MNKKFKIFLTSILPVILTALIGTIFFIVAKVDYDNIIKPPFSPPKVVFPIAWSILYILIGLSSSLYSHKVEESEEKTKAMIIFYIGLLFNLSWTLFYFVLDLKIFAAFWLFTLYVISASNFVIFYKRSKISGYLLIPYLIWLLFALYLNIGTALLN